MDGWTLEYDGEEQTFADWGLTAPTLTFLNQQIDTCTFDQPGAEFASDALFENGEDAIVRYNGVRQFYGQFRAPRRMGSAQGEGFSWKIEGPWHWLTETIFLQQWQVHSDTEDDESALVSAISARLFLGQTLAGALQDTAAQIIEIVNYAISQGATMALDTASIPAINIPVLEVKSSYASECLILMLKLAPDAVTWFDYTTEPWPTLKIKRRGTYVDGNYTVVLDAVDITPGDGLTLASANVVPRDELVVPAVIIAYEQINQVNGAQLRNQTFDIYPVGITGDPVFTTIPPKTLIAPINLEGASVSYAQATITCAQIYNASADWWKIKRPDLAKEYDANNPNELYVTDLIITAKARPSGLINELVAGQYADWMGGSFEDETVEAYVDYNCVQKVGSDEIRRKEYRGVPIQVKLKTTTLSSGTYYSSPSITSYGETIPVGMAQALYEATSVLQYDGEIVILEEQCSGLVKMGNVVNLIGEFEDFETMNGLVQEVVMNVGSGETVVRFGPPRHLGPDDLMEMLRGLRYRQRWTPLAARTTGRGGVSGNTQLGKDAAKESNTSSPVTKITETWYNSSAPGSYKVMIAISDLIAMGVTYETMGDIKLRVVPVCVMVAGVPTARRMVVLGSSIFV